jgi:hypothetical protein
MNILRVGLGVLIGLSLCACTLGSGRLETLQVDATGVRRVEFEGVGELEIVQGEQETLKIEAELDIIDRISAQVRGETLVISLRSGFWRGGTIPTRGIHYALVVKDLDNVRLSGAGSVLITGLETERLSVELIGAGATEAVDLAARELVVRHRGAGPATFSGEVETQDVQVAGAGSYKAADLASQSAQIEITGAGDATVWATQRLEAKIQGVGTIRYYGDPIVDQQISGIGQIKSLGAH